MATAKVLHPHVHTKLGPRGRGARAGGRAGERARADRLTSGTGGGVLVGARAYSGLAVHKWSRASRAASNSITGTSVLFSSIIKSVLRSSTGVIQLNAVF